MWRRSPALYRHMFSVLASTDDPCLCADELRRWAPVMAREDPPVVVKGELARAVMDCILVVEGEGYAGNGGEWNRLWHECVAAVGT